MFNNKYFIYLFFVVFEYVDSISNKRTLSYKTEYCNKPACFLFSLFSIQQRIAFVVILFSAFHRLVSLLSINLLYSSCSWGSFPLFCLPPGLLFFRATSIFAAYTVFISAKKCAGPEPYTDKKIFFETELIIFINCRRFLAFHLKNISRFVLNEFFRLYI